MDAVEFLKEKSRMMIKDVNSYNELKNIPTNEEVVKFVEQWSKKHPIKTRKMDFKEKYPKAEYHMDGIGTPNICCKKLGYTDCCPTGKSCVECWNEPVE